jgi:predicted transcriptional regulator of viral defense system
MAAMARPSAVDRHMDEQVRWVGGDDGIAALAARQYGVVARAQLAALGLGRGAIDRRLSRGRLHPLHRGVYAVGHRVVSREGWWMAAVLAAGPGAVLSHRSAAALWGLRGDPATRVEVSVPCKQRSRPGITVHYAPLPADEVTDNDGIPTTTAARTLLDLAAILQPQELERTLEQAEANRLTDHTPLDALLTRYPNRQGTKSLRAILHNGRHSANATRSELEDRFLALLDAHGLPRPEINVWLPDAGVEVDCLWRARRLIAELDSRKHHATTAAFERDRARDRTLQAAGWRVIRITWRQLHDHPEAVVSDLRELLCTAPRSSPVARAR